MSDVEEATGEWNYVQLFLALIVAFVVTCMLMPCLCNIGTAKTQVALVFLVLIVLRIAVARIRKEKGRGWIFYVIVIYTCPFWIEAASWLVFGRH